MVYQWAGIHKLEMLVEELKWGVYSNPLVAITRSTSRALGVHLMNKLAMFIAASQSPGFDVQGWVRENLTHKERVRAISIPDFPVFEEVAFDRGFAFKIRDEYDRIGRELADSGHPPIVIQVVKQIAQIVGCCHQTSRLQEDKYNRVVEAMYELRETCSKDKKGDKKWAK